MQAVLYARLFEKDPGVLKSVVSVSISMRTSPLLTHRPGRACIVGALYVGRDSLPTPEPTLHSLIDVLHTCMVWLADWQYLVGGFGDSNITDHVFWSAGVRLRHMRYLILSQATHSSSQ